MHENHPNHIVRPTLNHKLVVKEGSGPILNHLLHPLEALDHDLLGPSVHELVSGIDVCQLEREPDREFALLLRSFGEGGIDPEVDHRKLLLLFKILNVSD